MATVFSCVPVKGAPRRHGRGRSKNSEPQAARQSPADKPTARIPTRSRTKPNKNGEAACSLRAGADSNPLRRPYPWGPNNANGKVPLVIMIMPLPAPCNRANAMTQGDPTGRGTLRRADAAPKRAAPKRPDGTIATLRTRQCERRLGPGRPVQQRRLPREPTHPPPAASLAGAPPSLLAEPSR